ncbi:hypothetical protein PR001_g18480 [Phytophthora rubi]|uniref:DUF6818 domain-containing protein n=1 Tax=Phytophthora rubi TaxID=129364 RepID=A0A6A3K345_9STRA|nr:hypothetical protein PR001_g18480 [Phytophthora rubi]
MWGPAELTPEKTRDQCQFPFFSTKLKRKSRKTDHCKTKHPPPGNNDGIPPKLRPIALAHEVQHAIDMKAGERTSHDGFDGGQNDAHLLRDVAAVFDVAGVGDYDDYCHTRLGQ